MLFGTLSSVSQPVKQRTPWEAPGSRKKPPGNHRRPREAPGTPNFGLDDDKGDDGDDDDYDDDDDDDAQVIIIIINRFVEHLNNRLVADFSMTDEELRNVIPFKKREKWKESKRKRERESGDNDGDDDDDDDDLRCMGLCIVVPCFFSHCKNVM